MLSRFVWGGTADPDWVRRVLKMKARERKSLKQHMHEAGGRQIDGLGVANEDRWQ